MQIRESSEGDKETIFNLHQSAFGEVEGRAVATLAVDLLSDKTALPILSLVAESDSEIVGHILFTSVSVSDLDASNAYILAPLAVAHNMQGKGVGTALINDGIEKLRARGADFVLVLGDPKYYHRTGFSAEHHIKPPYQLDYPEAWMVQELRTDVLKDVRGTVQCAKSLSSPEHW